MKNKTYHQKGLAKIHIAKKELGLADESYRNVIRSVVPDKNSAANLTDQEIHRLLNRFHELGWRPQLRRQENRPLPPMVWKARNLWLELYQMGVVKTPDWTSLARFSKRMTGIQDLRQLNVKQGTVVIEALKNWIHREQRGKNPDSPDKKR